MMGLVQGPVGTKVLMANGSSRNIETIKPGDKVLAADPATDTTGARTVNRLVITDGDKHFDTLTITTPNGPQQLTATYEHPFWNPTTHHWTKARDLTPGTTLLSAKNTILHVRANHPYDQRTRTYNLTVEDLHTYYAMAGHVPVLVHNDDGSCNGGLGTLIKVNKPVPTADALANKIGGESRVRFENDPQGREFDAVSDQYVAQSKPAGFQMGSAFRKQAKATFEAAIKSGRTPYFHFDGPPDPGVLSKLDEYSQRYGVLPVIDIGPLV